jgi:hypothetical protein
MSESSSTKDQLGLGAYGSRVLEVRGGNHPVVRLENV